MVFYATGRPDIEIGEYLVLIDADRIETDSQYIKIVSANGDEFRVSLSANNELLATLFDPSATNPAYNRLRAYADAFAGSLALASVGQDYAATAGIAAALTAVEQHKLNFTPFGTVGWSKTRYDNGAKLDITSYSALAGLATYDRLNGGKLVFGGFFEGGKGNYTTKRSFENAAAVKGDDDSKYFGAGLLGRYGMNNGLYFDVSARFGRIDRDFRTDDIKYNDWKASFESESLYYGAHAGIGYALAAVGGIFDISSNLFWLRQNGDSFKVYEDKVKIDDADSLRLRIGGKYTYDLGKLIKPYAGAYWEYEADGKVKGSVNGNKIDTDNLKGSSAILEAGVGIIPLKNAPISIDLGIKVYDGKREGVAGNVQVMYKF